MDGDRISSRLMSLTKLAWSPQDDEQLAMAGIYLASENGKSAIYTSRSGKNGVMFLCEAALGNAWEINADGVIHW